MSALGLDLMNFSWSHSDSLGSSVVDGLELMTFLLLMTRS